MALIGVFRSSTLSPALKRLVKTDAFTLFYLSHLFFYPYMLLLVLHAEASTLRARRCLHACNIA